MKGQRPSKDNGSRAKNPARVKCEADRVAAAIRNRGEGHRREDEARPVGHLTLGMGRAMNPVRRGERTASNSKAHYEGRGGGRANGLSGARRRRRIASSEGLGRWHKTGVFTTSASPSPEQRADRRKALIWIDKGN